ncbi:52 kDa repressor of the inhibitor of the protein kinase-like [Artemia franciscana]|uniref:52 kDa repressor of the inhibitor of the protein kinase-like n=1 Tax=Artemia franciscana TaxID=6661 RepID=UPI0032DAC968
MVSLQCLHSICALTLPLSRLFQKKTLDLGAADCHVSDLLDVLAKRRETYDEEFAVVFEQVKELSDKIQLGVEVPKITQRQVHRNNPPHSTPEEYYRRVVIIPMLDSVISDLKSRFSRDRLSSFQLTVLLQSNIVNCTDYLLQSSVKAISSMYGQLLGLTVPSTRATLILAEVHVWRSRWRRVKREGSIFPFSVEETAKECDRNLNPYVSSLLDIFISLPATVASAEPLRKLKTWLRGQMGQTRLSGLALLNGHRGIDISIDRAIDRFVNSGARKLEFCL